MDQLLADHTPSATVTMAYSPALIAPASGGLGEGWHYGFGLWQEYQGNPYAGTPGSRLSSPGSYGAYPFWDKSKGYFGIVARRGAQGTFPEGVGIERSGRSLAEEWAVLP